MLWAHTIVGTYLNTQTAEDGEWAKNQVVAGVPERFVTLFVVRNHGTGSGVRICICLQLRRLPGMARQPSV